MRLFLKLSIPTSLSPEDDHFGCAHWLVDGKRSSTVVWLSCVEGSNPSAHNTHSISVPCHPLSCPLVTPFFSPACRFCQLCVVFKLGRVEDATLICRFITAFEHRFCDSVQGGNVTGLLPLRRELITVDRYSFA